MRSIRSVAGSPSRDRAVIASCIVLISALAWAYLFYLNRQMPSSPGSATMMGTMETMTSRRWGAADFFFTFSMWSVMMVGMMSPSAAPVLLLFSDMQRSRDGTAKVVLLLGLGYLAVWLGFSAAAALAQWRLHEAALLSPALSTTNARLAGAILIAAGTYQLTPAKGACLRQCQSPLGFLMANWREGAKGAFRMGLGHGCYCLGCCWAVMCVLFAVGVMNLAWVAALTALILVEKFWRQGVLVARVAGVVMIGYGVLVVAREIV